MKKIVSIALSIIVGVLIAGCNRSAAVKESNNPHSEGHILYLGCEFPGEDSPRMVLDHPNLSTPLRMYWEAGDNIQIGFRQGGVTGSTSVTVQSENIQSNRTLVKNVPVSVPSGIDTSKPYKIYLAWGPGGTLAYNNNDGIFYLQLPQMGDIFSTGSTDFTTSNHYAKKKLPILYTKKEMKGGEQRFSVKLQHLGSFFVLHLANRTSTWNSSYWCKIEDKASWEADNEGMYVWNNGLPNGVRNNFGSKFNLETETPMPTLNAGTDTRFNGKKAYPGIVWDDIYLPYVKAGGVEQVRYVWYPVSSGVQMPALRFSIARQPYFSGGYNYSSEKCLPAGRKLESGKVYHFYIEIQSGYKPVFCDRNWRVRTDVVN